MKNQLVEQEFITLIQKYQTFIYQIFSIFHTIRCNPAEKSLTQSYLGVLIYQKHVKISTITGIVLAIPLTILVRYWRHIYETWLYLYITLLLLILIGSCIGLYRYIMKNLKNIQQSLKELEEFEKEE